jgi:hypothetical protein
MKKLLAFVLMASPVLLSAQSLDGLQAAAQDNSGKNRFSVSANAVYKTVDFYWKNEVGSRLTWRDVSLAGAQAEIKIPTKSSRAEFIVNGSWLSSNSGYSTDDDLDNYDITGNPTVSWGPVKADEQDISILVSKTIDKATKARFGLKFKRGDYKMYQAGDILDSNGWSWIPGYTGATQKYAFYNFGPSIGVEAKLVNAKKFKTTFVSDLSVSYYHASADWPLRVQYEHPKSFEDDGLNAGLQTKVDMEYDFSKHVAITGFLGLEYFRNPFKMNRTIHTTQGDLDSKVNQVIYTAMSAGLGLKISF